MIATPVLSSRTNSETSNSVKEGPRRKQTKPNKLGAADDTNTAIEGAGKS